MTWAARVSLVLTPIILLALAPREQTVPQIKFENVGTKAGLRCSLQNHPTAEKNNIEAMPGGIATLDYNNDGLPDIYFTNGAEVPSLRKTTGVDDNRLFRNDGNLHFTDVTDAAGVAGEGFSNGVAAGDFDNDGFPDIFVAGAYRNLLFHNLRNGRFAEISKQAGIRSDDWAAAAAWVDFDNDGLLDLFVTNYARWDPTSKSLWCGDQSKNLRIYCHPKDYAGLPNRLYRNLGSGRFEDVSAQTGISSVSGRGMSVAVADYDGDGFQDIFVTNDQMQNFLFHNVGGKRFEEVALDSGVGLLDSGNAVSNMGTDFRDYDNDGKPDILSSALAGETFPLFHNDGRGFFHDATVPSGVARATAVHSAWCTAFVDLNNDGLKDIFTSNSHVNDLIERGGQSQYKESNMVLANVGDGQFRDVSERAGTEFVHSIRAHRGCAFADFDGDGKTDVVVTALGEAPELWHNLSPTASPWLDVKLKGSKSSLDAVGAKIRIDDQYQVVSPAAGYASSSDVPIHFGGIGAGAFIQIRWPSGKLQALRIGRLNTTLTLEEPRQ